MWSCSVDVMADLVDCRAHVVVDAAAGNAAKDAEGAALAQLRMRDLQLGALIADDSPADPRTDQACSAAPAP